MPATAAKTIVLISGANQGVGAATATLLAKEPLYHIIIGTRTLSSGLLLANTLKSSGYSADAVQLDVLSDSSIAAAASYITETYGHIDVLINNAGICWDRKEDLPTRKL